MCLRHVKNLNLRDVEIVALNEEARPAIIMENAEGVDLFHIKTPQSPPVLRMQNSTEVSALLVRGLRDGKQVKLLLLWVVNPLRTDRGIQFFIHDEECSKAVQVVGVSFAI